MRLAFFVGCAMSLALSGCGGEDGPSPGAGGGAGGNAPPPTSGGSPSTTLFNGINDSLVQLPAVPSADRATFGRRPYQATPTITRIGSRLWTVWMGDHLHLWESPGNFLILSYSDDDGATWSPETYLIPQNIVTDRAFDPRLWPSPDGKLWIIYTQSGGSQIFDGQLGTWANVMDNPLGETPHFEPGFWLTDGLAQWPFAYNGKLYFNTDYLRSDTGESRHRERDGEHLFELDWQNRKAKYVVTLPKVPNVEYNEGQFLVLKDNRLVYQSRSYDGIYQSVTAPGSLAFGAPQRWAFFPSVASRHVLGRSPSGRLFMVFNQEANPSRTKMTVAFSDDEGQTWPYSAVIDTRLQISYPDVVFNEAGDKMFVMYDRSRAKTPEIVITTVSEAAIVAGQPGAFSSRTVNQQP